MKKFFRISLSLLVALLMLCPYGQVALAHEVDTPAEPIDIDEYGTNSLIAMCAGTIDENVDSISCVLNSATPQCTVFATVSANDVSSSSSVDCYIILPNGSMYNMGLVPATGGTSFSLNFNMLLPGEYTFYFEASTSEELSVAGFIYV